MERIYENNKIRWNLFVLVDILKKNLKIVFQKYSFVILSCFSHVQFSINYLISLK